MRTFLVFEALNAGWRDDIIRDVTGPNPGAVAFVDKKWVTKPTGAGHSISIWTAMQPASWRTGTIFDAVPASTQQEGPRTF
jgi:hypothetical protein